MKKQSYLIFQTEAIEPSFDKGSLKTHGKFIEFTCGLLRMDKKTINGNDYPRELVEPALKDQSIIDKMNANRWWGESGHPDKNEVSTDRFLTIDHTNASHRISKPYFDGNMLMGTISSLAATEVGRSLRDAVLYDELIPAFSFRGGTLLERLPDGSVNKTLKIVTWDWVNDPSCVEAVAMMPTMQYTSRNKSEQFKERMVITPQDVTERLSDIPNTMANFDEDIRQTEATKFSNKLLQTCDFSMVTNMKEVERDLSFLTENVNGFKPTKIMYDSKNNFIGYYTESTSIKTKVSDKLKKEIFESFGKKVR